MTDEGRKTIIRHLKGIVAALEKEGMGEVEAGQSPLKDLKFNEVEDIISLNRFEKDIDARLDKEWNNKHEHIMTWRHRLGEQRLSSDVIDAIKNTATKRSIKVCIEPQGRRSTVTFSK